MIKKMSIIGLGLMGGSLAKAIKDRNLDIEIMAFDTNQEYIVSAIEDGAIDYGAESIEEAALFADMIVLTTPIRYFDYIARIIDNTVTKKTLLIDFGSVKSYVADVFKKIDSKYIKYIGVHPMTGSEKSGYNASDTYLYENAYCFICPDNSRDSELEIEEISKLFKLLGSFPVIIDSQEHDKTVSLISHLPHVIAASLIKTLDIEHGLKKLPFIGGGFRDTTRIAAGESKLWVDILLYNQKEVLKAIEEFKNSLNEIESLITNSKDRELDQYLNASSVLRKSLPQKTRDYIENSYEIQVSVPDRPGILAELTSGLSQVNIKQIEILHSRESSGAVRISFGTEQEREIAISIIENKGFRAIAMVE